MCGNVATDGVNVLAWEAETVADWEFLSLAQSNAKETLLSQTLQSTTHFLHSHTLNHKVRRASFVRKSPFCVRICCDFAVRSLLFVVELGSGIAWSCIDN